MIFVPFEKLIGMKCRIRLNKSQEKFSVPKVGFGKITKLNSIALNDDGTFVGFSAQIDCGPDNSGGRREYGQHTANIMFYPDDTDAKEVPDHEAMEAKEVK